MSPSIVRFDRVDVFLFLWLATYAVLSEGPDCLPIFPAGHALLVLVMILLARRAFVPEAHRMIQFVNATLLSLASGSALAMVPWQNQFVKYGATVFFFMMACVWAREFIAGAFGINAATAVEIKGLRSLFLVTGIVPAVVMGATAIFFLDWADTARPLFFSLWLLPFGVNWFCVRRLPLGEAKGLLQHPELWLRTFGSAHTILGVITVISLFGFLLEFLFPQHNYLVWLVLSGILVLQGLVVVEIRRWASLPNAA